MFTVYKESFTNALQGRIRENLIRYSEDEMWASAQLGGAARLLATRVDPVGKLELLTPDGEDLKDAENAVRLHKYLISLSPRQARDPRLWVKLAHEDAWEYMRLRWTIDRPMRDPSKAAQRIKDRYFVATAQSRALMRHGLARLWWCAALTHDPSRTNAYEATFDLFRQQDIATTIVERNIGRIRPLVGGMLDVLRSHPKLFESGDANRLAVRGMAKRLNMEGGVSVLDMWSRQDFIDLLTPIAAAASAP